MQNKHLPYTMARVLRFALLSALAASQCVALGEFFSDGVIFDQVTSVPIFLMFLFHLTSFALASGPSDHPKVALIWRCLFAANVGYAVILVPIMMRPSPCTRMSFVNAAAVALKLYGPILLARVCLRRPLTVRKPDQERVVRVSSQSEEGGSGLSEFGELAIDTIEGRL